LAKPKDACAGNSIEVVSGTAPWGNDARTRRSRSALPVEIGSKVAVPL
jgi:hypothetical protein